MHILTHEEFMMQKGRRSRHREGSGPRFVHRPQNQSCDTTVFPFCQSATQLCGSLFYHVAQACIVSELLVSLPVWGWSGCPIAFSQNMVVLKAHRQVPRV